MSIRRVSLGFLAACLLCLSAGADDWPQWRGPERTGVSKEKGLLKEWPKDGPKLLWENKDLGGGYSTPAIVGDRIYLMTNTKDEESAVALDVKDGKQVWSTPVGKVGKNDGPQYPGTRSTPTVDGDRLYVLGSDGDLACLERDKGKVVWAKNFRKDFEGKPGMWAYSESVLIDGDTLVCTPGGKEATMVALNKKDGSVIWKCAVKEGDKAAYSSPIIAQVGKVKQYVQFVGGGVVGVDAKTGKELWRYDHTKDPAANIPTPVFHDDCVFTSTSRNGSGLNRLKADGDSVSSEEVYHNKTALNSIGGVVRVGDYLYGVKMVSFTEGELVCMDFKTGEVKWHDASVGIASVCYADGMLYVRGQGGTGFGPEKAKPQVALVEAKPDGYKEKGRFEQPDHGDRPAWPHPVVANGKLYLRDQGVLLCYDVKAEK
jgi:outer membrane protein assembly factor BamB